MPDLLRTHLHDRHVALGATMVDFAGWSMPVRYGSIVEEHHAVRTGCGLFDIGHMGRLRVGGADAAGWLDSLVTASVASMPVGRVRYALVCREDGGILDDILIDRHGEEEFGLVVNASNREKIVAHFASHARDDVSVVDQTRQTAMIAAQGPLAAAVIDAWAGAAVSTSLRYYRGVTFESGGIAFRISRTGYTGEDGFEVICDDGGPVWDTLQAVRVDGLPDGPLPCGLGARDTLRLEAAMPLYGHELSEEIDPLTAGLEFAVKTDVAFHGSEAIAKVRGDGPGRSRVGLKLSGKRPAREGSVVLAGGGEVGTVMSGGPSPTLGSPIAMAYVTAGSVSVGDAVEVDVRGKAEPAEVVPLPFYERPKN
ncbi:MAG: glycine cleavage system aminomethyltransferase GcvT [Planctomycetota bacterium]